MSELLPILAAAFLSGLLGSAHCLGMCAGLSGLFAAGVAVTSLQRQLSLAIAYNIGRIASYAFLGFLAAALSSGLVHLIPLIAGPIRLLSGVIIIAIGLQVAFAWPLLGAAEKLGAVLWRRIAPLTKAFVPATNVNKAAALGVFWGWLPCGLVYGALLMAATSASPVNGALIMSAFGLGTLPAMVASGLGASRLAAFMSRNRLGAGALIVLLGIATMAMPLYSLGSTSGHGGHSHHSAAL